MVRSIAAAAVLAALLAACTTTAPPPATGGAQPAAAPAEPVLLENTPYPDTLTVILPPGEPSARARGLARVGCPRNTQPAMIEANGNQYVFRCTGVISPRVRL